MEKEAINPANLMTIKDYALLVGKKRQTIFNWVKGGKVKKVSYLGRQWIDKSTLNQKVA